MFAAYGGYTLRSVIEAPLIADSRSFTGNLLLVGDYGGTKSKFDMSVDDREDVELETLIAHTERCKELGKKDDDKFQRTAELFTTNYRGIALTCVDPCQDEVREVIAVVNPEVSLEDIAKEPPWRSPASCSLSPSPRGSSLAATSGSGPWRVSVS
jgi:hypothetical protein